MPDRSTRAMDAVIAASLIALVREHQKACQDEHCIVVLSLLRPTYEQLVGRELTFDEAMAFA